MSRSVGQHDALQHAAHGARSRRAVRSRRSVRSFVDSSALQRRAVAKCGLSLLSYIDSADPMAMCMSRYL